MDKRIPQHIGIIIDGNRRWARRHGLPIAMGHKRGYEKLKEVARWCFERGVKVLTCYVFSMENWNRKKTEVAFLMKLLEKAVTRDLGELQKQDMKLKISGRINDVRLPKSLRNAIVRAQEKTKNNTKGVLNLALNYGGRAEIVDAMNKIVKLRLQPYEITEEIIEQNLYTQGLPDPDLIIRTSEKRLSGFLLWQCAYSELYFIEKYWPDFSEEDLERALEEYARRQRKFGR